MAIEIYDKAKIIKKDNKYYYFLKNGSSNSFTCPFQTIVDEDFNNKFIRRQTEIAIALNTIGRKTKLKAINS